MHADPFRTETIWHSGVLASSINSALLLGGRLYGFHGGLLQAVDATTGTELWKARGFQRGALIAADGRLVVLGEAGNLALVAASASAFEELGQAPLLSGRSWTAPALAQGRLYLRNQTELVCVDLRRPVEAGS